MNRACSALALGDSGQPELMVPQPYSSELFQLYSIGPENSKPAFGVSCLLHRNFARPACELFRNSQLGRKSLSSVAAEIC